MASQRTKEQARKRFWIAGGLVFLLLAVGGAIGFRQFRGAETNEQCALVQNTEEGVDRGARAGLHPKLAVLGDSYTQGMYLDKPTDAYPYLLDPTALVDGSGGSGYSSGGPCGSNQLTNRVAHIIGTKPAMLIIQSGINDRHYSDVGVAARSLFDRVAKESADTRVIVLGPFNPPAVAGPELDAVADAIKDAAESRKLTYVDPRGWNFDLLADGLHPSQRGHQQIAEKLREAIRQ
jgi:lysophospholipase L1-like esterase